MIACPTCSAPLLFKGQVCARCQTSGAAGVKPVVVSRPPSPPPRQARDSATVKIPSDAGKTTGVIPLCWKALLLLAKKPFAWGMFLASGAAFIALTQLVAWKSWSKWGGGDTFSMMFFSVNVLVMGPALSGFFDGALEAVDGDGSPSFTSLFFGARRFGKTLMIVFCVLAPQMALALALPFFYEQSGAKDSWELTLASRPFSQGPGHWPPVFWLALPFWFLACVFSSGFCLAFGALSDKPEEGFSGALNKSWVLLRSNVASLCGLALIWLTAGLGALWQAPKAANFAEDLVNAFQNPPYQPNFLSLGAVVGGLFWAGSVWFFTALALLYRDRNPIHHGGGELFET